MLKDQAQIQNWFGKTITSKFHSTLQYDGSEVYSTVYKAPYPLNNRELIHRRLLNCDDSKNLYMFNFTTIGLESVSFKMLMMIQVQSKTKSKNQRAFHNLCGLIVRPGILNEKGEVVGSKIFYVMQMEFSWPYV